MRADCVVFVGQVLPVPATVPVKVQGKCSTLLINVHQIYYWGQDSPQTLVS